MPKDSGYPIKANNVARVIIIGAGIAGMAAAIGLRRLKIRAVTVKFGQVPLKQADRVYWFATRNYLRNDRSRTNCKDDLLAFSVGGTSRFWS
jgi:glycine/D-amino acid oxidase-like deaminating enzyme